MKVGLCELFTFLKWWFFKNQRLSRFLDFFLGFGETLTFIRASALAILFFSFCNWGKELEELKCVESDEINMKKLWSGTACAWNQGTEKNYCEPGPCMRIVRFRITWSHTHAQWCHIKTALLINYKIIMH